MVTATRDGDLPPEGDPIRSGLVRRLSRSRGTRVGRRNLLLIAGAAIVLVIVLMIAVSVVLFSSLSGESASYKSGYTVGGSVYSSDSAEAGAQAACQAAQSDPVGVDGMPEGDDPTQWIKGCVAGFEAAQSGT